MTVVKVGAAVSSLKDKSFEVKSVVDPDGKVHRFYTYKRKPCRRVVLKSRICDQLAGYLLIEKDLRSVLVWLNQIDHLTEELQKTNRSGRVTDRDNGNLVKGLFVAALTFYGKCFSKCEGRPVKLEKAQLDKRFHELHEDCIAYRHNFAAHSGAKKIERVDIALVYPEKYSRTIPYNLYKELDQPDFIWTRPGEIKIVEMVEHVRSIAEKKANFLWEKIEKDEVLAVAERFWTRK